MSGLVTGMLKVARTRVEPESLRKVRAASGLTQGQLSVLVGVSRQTYASWESGTHKPRGVRKVRLIDVVAELVRQVNGGSK